MNKFDFDMKDNFINEKMHSWLLVIILIINQKNYYILWLKLKVLSLIMYILY